MATDLDEVYAWRLIYLNGYGFLVNAVTRYSAYC